MEIWNNSWKKNTDPAWNLRTWFLAKFRGLKPLSKLSMDRIIQPPLLHTNLGAIIRLQTRKINFSLWQPFCSQLPTLSWNILVIWMTGITTKKLFTTYRASELFLPLLTAISHSNYATLAITTREKQWLRQVPRLACYQLRPQKVHGFKLFEEFCNFSQFQAA